MQSRRLKDDDVQRFMQGCEDLMNLGTKFTDNIRSAVADLKKAYEPALKSQYVDKVVVELLTRSLEDFEKKIESSLEGIDKICTKGAKWFAFYLGRTVEGEIRDEDSQIGPVKVFEPRKDPAPSLAQTRFTKRAGGQ